MKDLTVQMLRDVRYLRTNGAWENGVPAWAQTKAKQLGLASSSPTVVEWALFQIIEDLETINPIPVLEAGEEIKSERPVVERLKEIGQKASTNASAMAHQASMTSRQVSNQVSSKIKSFGNYLGSKLTSPSPKPVEDQDIEKPIEKVTI